MLVQKFREIWQYRDLIYSFVARDLKVRYRGSVLALALIHHLAISNNLPFEKIAAFLDKLCRTLIIEFVPKNDSQVQWLLATREDIFPDYTQESFERAFGKFFVVKEVEKIPDSERMIYLMRKKNA